LSVFICRSWNLNICVFVIRDTKEKAAHFFNKFTVCVLIKDGKEIYKKNCYFVYIIFATCVCLSFLVLMCEFYLSTN